MKNFTRQYIATALWSSSDDNGEPLDSNYDPSDLAPETLERIVKDCESFQAKAGELITEDNFDGSYDIDVYGRFGHDFWLTRNGHGAGFWDGDYSEPAATELTKISKSFGQCDLYIGDDQKLYFF